MNIKKMLVVGFEHVRFEVNVEEVNATVVMHDVDTGDVVEATLTHEELASFQDAVFNFDIK